jgi:hypothetical protein
MTAYVDTSTVVCGPPLQGREELHGGWMTFRCRS